MLSYATAEPHAGRSNLTKANLRAFTNATKRDAAHRRGEPTPSPEPLHLGDSNDTERFFQEHPLLRRDRAAEREFEKEGYEPWKPTVLPRSDHERGDNWGQKPPTGSPVNREAGRKKVATTAADPPRRCDSNGQTKTAEITAARSNTGLSLFAAHWGTDPQPFGPGLGSIFGPDGGGPLKPWKSQGPATENAKPGGFQQAAPMSSSGRDKPEAPRAQIPRWPEPKTGQLVDGGIAPLGDHGPYTVEQANPLDFGQDPKHEDHVLASTFPQGFPRYQSVSDFREIAVFLANAQYVVSLGGPALKDMKYGVVIVPSGDEKLLLTKQPEDAITSEFFDDIKRVAYKTRKLHEGTASPAMAVNSMEGGDAAQKPPVPDADVAKRKSTGGESAAQKHPVPGADVSKRKSTGGESAAQKPPVPDAGVAKRKRTGGESAAQKPPVPDVGVAKRKRTGGGSKPAVATTSNDEAEVAQGATSSKPATRGRAAAGRGAEDAAEPHGTTKRDPKSGKGDGRESRTSKRTRT